jgi:hypothetical protein
MGDRTCPRCGKVFRYPCHMRSHLANRKTPCTTIVDIDQLPADDQKKQFSCKFCYRRFSSEQSMWRHVREFCKVMGSAEGMDKLYEHTLKQQLDAERQRGDRLEARLDQLMCTVLSQQAPPGGTVQQQVAQSIVNEGNACKNVISISVNAFGRESTNHIGQPEIKALLDDVLRATPDPAQAAITAFLKTAMLIYSDPARPENLTCYLPNSKTDNVLVHGDAGWEVKPYTVVMPPMAKRSVDTLFDNQPFVDADKYGDLMVAVRENEQAYKEGKQMRTVLVRNKDLLQKALGALPK